MKFIDIVNFIFTYIASIFHQSTDSNPEYNPIQTATDPMLSRIESLRLGRLLFFLPFFVALTGCSTTMSVSNSIPYKVQQNIQTVSGDGVAFQFKPHSGAEEIVANVDMGSSINYRVNEPLRGMYHELVRTKFGNVDEAASETVVVEVADITTSTRNPAVGTNRSHTISLTIRVSATRDGVSTDQSLNYKTTFPARQVPGASGKYTFPQGSVQDFLLKFIVSSDKFIDATYTDA